MASRRVLIPLLASPSDVPFPSQSGKTWSMCVSEARAAGMSYVGGAWAVASGIAATGMGTVDGIDDPLTLILGG